MIRISTVFLVVGLVALLGVVGVSAQENGGNATTYAGAFGGVNIVSYDYDNGVMSATLEADSSREIKLVKTSEVTKQVFESGGGAPPDDALIRETLPAGRTEIEIPIETYQGKAVVGFERRGEQYFAVEDNAVSIWDPEGWLPIFVVLFFVFVICVGTGYVLMRFLSETSLKNAGANA